MALVGLTLSIFRLHQILQVERKSLKLSFPGDEVPLLNLVLSKVSFLLLRFWIYLFSYLSWKHFLVIKDVVTKSAGKGGTYVGGVL